MNIDKLKEFYLANLDADLGTRLTLSKSTISKWRKFGIPQEVQAVFEVQTQGALKASLPKYKSFKANKSELAQLVNNKSIKTN